MERARLLPSSAACTKPRRRQTQRKEGQKATTGETKGLYLSTLVGQGSPLGRIYPRKPAGRVFLPNAKVSQSLSILRACHARSSYLSTLEHITGLTGTTPELASTDTKECPAEGTQMRSTIT